MLANLLSAGKDSTTTANNSAKKGDFLKRRLSQLSTSRCANFFTCSALAYE